MPAQVDSSGAAAAQLLPPLLEQCWELVKASFKTASGVAVHRWSTGTGGAVGDTPEKWQYLLLKGTA